MAADERFCTSCGAPMATDPVSDPVASAASDPATALAPDLAAGPAAATAPAPTPTLVSLDVTPAHSTARKWLLAISIITLLSGFVFYAIQKRDVEKEIRLAEDATAYMDPAERDQLMLQEVGMTFEEALAHDRGMVTLLLVVNIVLAVIYFVLWFWAKKNPYTAALIALLLFLTVIVVSAVLEPESLSQGVIVKALFIAALVRALKAGADARKLAGIV